MAVADHPAAAAACSSSLLHPEPARLLGEGAAGAGGRSCTSPSRTRRVRRRPTEEHGREYYFITVPMIFRSGSRAANSSSHAQVFDNYYGTGRRPLKSSSPKGRNVILEIDWQGARLVTSCAAGVPQHLHPAAVAAGARRAAAESQDRLGRSHRPPPARLHRRYVPLERVRLRRRERRLQSAPSPTSGRIVDGQGEDLRAGPRRPANRSLG